MRVLQASMVYHLKVCKTHDVRLQKSISSNADYHNFLATN